MAEPFPNPDIDLDRLRSFLEKGAETSLEVVESFAATERVEATAGEPGTIVFDITAARLQEHVAGDEQVRVLLDLGTGEVKAADSFFVHLFLNTPEASIDSTEEEPGFAGGLSFFCEPDDEMPEMACPIGDVARISRLNITGKLGEIQGADEALTATLVLVPAQEGGGDDGALTVLSAELSVVRSVVTIAS
jgi:hypothetical protein